MQTLTHVRQENLAREDQRREPATRPSAFAFARDFLDNRFVYVVVSPRALGLSVGVNVNPDRACNFDCVYCEVHRKSAPLELKLDVTAISQELRRTVTLVTSGRLHERHLYRTLPAELLQLRHVTLSGDGEPTLAAKFADLVEAVIHARAVGEFPFFKLVLATNAAGFDRPQVQAALKRFTGSDEIWAKLEWGTQAYMDRIARPRSINLAKIMDNILLVARQRPVIIQSLFPALSGQEPPLQEIQEYALRLKELADAGAQIPQVQIYSATRPMPYSVCGHLPLKTLSRIAQTVRQISGLHAEVF